MIHVGKRMRAFVSIDGIIRLSRNLAISRKDRGGLDSRRLIESNDRSEKSRIRISIENRRRDVFTSKTMHRRVEE